MTASSAEELASNVVNLVSFPDVAFRIEEKLADENSSIGEIAKVIEVDPAVSAALLRLANSASYGACGQVSSVSRAVMVVGLRDLRDLTYCICAAQATRGLENDIISVEDFWRHSLYCAVGARLIASVARCQADGSPFTAGLLHDIGQLVMYHQDPDASRAALEVLVDLYDGTDDFCAERDVFHYDHAAVGAALAERWNLPSAITRCIRYHHEPYSADEVSETLLMVHIANSLAVLVELDSVNFNDAPPIDDRALDSLGLARNRLLAMVDDIKAESDDLVRVFVNSH